jgi:hypothetical protein
MKLILIPSILLMVAMLACGGGSSSGGGAVTPPGSINWQPITTPFSHANFIDFGSNGHWFAADRSQGFYRSTDGGSTWSAINSGIATNFGWTVNVSPSNGNLIAGIYSPGGPGLHPVVFYRSTDEGSSWTAIQSGPLDASPAWTGCAFAANSNVVCGGYWASSPATGGWFSTNGGQTVSAATTASTNGTTIFALALNPMSHDLWMGTEQFGIFRSTDNGAPRGQSHRRRTHRSTPFTGSGTATCSPLLLIETEMCCSGRRAASGSHRARGTDIPGPTSRTTPIRPTV